jgi:DNA replication protein DnaC
VKTRRMATADFCQTRTYVSGGIDRAVSSLIVLDDWGLTALATQDRADLLEILDDRINTGATLIASQLPVDTWHAYLGEPTLAINPSNTVRRARCASRRPH